MGEILSQLSFDFNRSVRVESRPERITSDSGALLLREALQKLEIIPWLVRRLDDPRDPSLITHPFAELLRTRLILLAQGWRDQDDADVLRDDPALRLAVSDRRGVSALYPGPDQEGERRSKNPPVPEGLASQPTLSRLLGILSSEEQRQVLRDGLVEMSSRRLKQLRRGHRPRYLTVDLDSLPMPVEGHQPGARYNGYYRVKMYHALIASVGETGDLLGGILREGSVHTAEGGCQFLLPLLDKVERKLCQVASVRIDAGFPEDEFLGGLEERGTGYVARMKSNAVLDHLAAPYLKRPVGRPPAEPRMWFHELRYRAAGWSRERRLVLVVQERPGELFLHHFWLVTNWSAEQMPAADLLELYRQRGTAEGHQGELMDVLAPALSSSPRPKRHYRGREPVQRFDPCDGFAHNEALLLLNMLAYNLSHAVRVLLEKATRTGWSLRRLRELVLKTAGRFVLGGGRALLVLGRDRTRYWSWLLAWLSRLKPLDARCNPC